MFVSITEREKRTKSRQCSYRVSIMFVSIAEREKRTESLLDMQKSKQERSDQELQSLRDLYTQQERDITLLQLNLDGTKEIMSKQQERYLAKG